MKIKKQFTILSIIIIAIPILCTLFIMIQQYFYLSNAIFESSSQISRFDTRDLSQKDTKSLADVLRILPNNIESCIINKDGRVIYTSMPEIQISRQQENDNIYRHFTNTSEKFFYQFTSLNMSDGNVILVTRMLRDKKNTITRENLIISTILFLFVVVIFCVFYVIKISKTIFTSVIQIEKSTEQLANGNLHEKIELPNSKILQNEITSILNGLEKMRISLIDEQSRKNKFIMGISHDLRTPVAVIKGYTEAIADGIITDQDELKNTLDLIHNKTDQLEGVIDTLINFMKMNANQLKEAHVPGSITTLIKNFAKEASVTAYVFKRNIITNIDLPVEIVVPLNEQLVLRAFENLFSNAIRYTKDNDEIQINSYIDEQYVYLKVKDTGIGIEEKDLAYIFDMFYRGTNSRKEGGMGIGLSVVKNIIDNHGWQISVSSKKDKGSCFTVTIPYQQYD